MPKEQRRGRVLAGTCDACGFGLLLIGLTCTPKLPEGWVVESSGLWWCPRCADDPAEALARRACEVGRC